VKVRADVAMVSQGLTTTRSQARALLMAGRVFWGERRVDKVGTLLPEGALLEVRGEKRFVSRGGYKLEGALRDLDLKVAGAVAVDVGASTGGFTRLPAAGGGGPGLRHRRRPGAALGAAAPGCARGGA
jgi:23S rRNA (cytidine1920-2'-O)/16S rRNA (cytidine1409-2'-O)-methyltransferase